MILPKKKFWIKTKPGQQDKYRDPEFYDEDLKFMNRAHNSKEALDAVKFAHGNNGSDNITIDLIYGTSTPHPPS